MLTKDKILKFCVPFETKESEDDSEDLVISGRASTNDEDRSGDIIVSDAWKDKGALKNYLKNPVILAFHDMSQPIGKTIEHEIDEKGLTITAKISKTADKIIGLIKEGILSSFSIGFIIKDADFDTKSGIFLIKELELLEVSVVSVPANQNALFNIEKNFSDSNEYAEFRNQFIKSKSEETLRMDKDKEKDSVVDVTKLAAQIAASVKSSLKAEEEATRIAKEAEEAKEARIEATANSAVEKLAKELREELTERDGKISDALAEVTKALKQGADKDELSDEFSKDKDNKMKFAKDNKTKLDTLTTSQKDGMLYASKLLNIPIHETKTFKDFVRKSEMEHWDAGVTGEWEDEYSTRIQDALREQLVVESLFTSIPMNTPTLNMPINPEAGDASWVHGSSFRSSQNPALETGDGTDTSTGAAVDHQLDEQVMVAYKLATREYVGYEEEEDSIVTLAPVINDAVARRMARTSDLAYLRGAGILTNTAAYDPITGLEARGANTTDQVILGGGAWEANVTEDSVADMRRELGLYGLNPTELVLLVSHDYYYELLKLANFKTVDVLGEARATILTGQVGSIFGVRVVISQMFDNAAIAAGTNGTTLAIMVSPKNFLTGVLRGITTESDRDIINQKRVIVSSRRFAFQDIITGEATVNLQISS